MNTDSSKYLFWLLNKAISKPYLLRWRLEIFLSESKFSIGVSKIENGKTSARLQRWI